MDPLIVRIKRILADTSLWPPAKAAEIEMAEKQIGFSLPSLLKELYTEVGNGGFGPGYGILGIVNGWAPNDDSCYTADRLYSAGLNGQWKNLLPIGYYGCATYALLNCKIENGPVLLSEEGTVKRKPMANSLRDWLEAWLEPLEAKINNL